MSVFTNSAASTPGEVAQYKSAVLDLLGDRDPLKVLEATPEALRRSIEDLTREETVRPEAPGKWSIAVALQHLADSELVGGYRFRMILAQDRPVITGYDQDQWAKRLHYGDADTTTALLQFGVLRQSNVALLGRASPADRQRIGVHAERGEETLEETMRLYAGHDLLHLAQIDRIRQALGHRALGDRG